MLFHTHLPWAFQFGTGRDATVVLFGKLYAPHGGDPKDVLWWQLQTHEGGVISIDNADGRLDVADISTAAGRAGLLERIDRVPRRRRRRNRGPTHADGLCHGVWRV